MTRISQLLTHREIAWNFWNDWNGWNNQVALGKQVPIVPAVQSLAHVLTSVDQCPHSRGTLLIRNADHVPGSDRQGSAKQIRELRGCCNDSFDPWHLPLSSVAAVIDDGIHFG